MSTQRKVVHLESLITHWQIAVKQYSDACNAMVLLNGQSLRSHRTRLMASVLLACFDSFIGDHKQAIVQIQAGLGLIEQIQTMYPKHQNPRPEGFIEEDLLIIFTRLAIQAKSYDMAFHFPQPYVIRLAAQHSTLTGPSTSFLDAGSSGGRSDVSIPSRFTSLVDARVASDKLNEKLLRFIEHLQIAKNDKSNVLPASWKHYGMDLKGQLDAWGAAFEHIFKSRTGPQISSVEQAAISALKMFHINTNVLFMMMFCDTESHFDGFLPQFKAIVNLGWEVICAERRRVSTDDVGSDKCSPRQHVGATGTLSQIKPSFSADLGIVPPLFVVATKCREPRLRRQAIRLLRSSARREGMWDSELAANIGHWIMTVEEGGDAAQPHQHNSEPMPTEPIPEERRVMVKSVDFDLRDRFADLRVGTRAVHEGQTDSRVRVTRLTW
ncbi:C6 zinc finger domain protein [Moelleriella libera RCEF 2490]|uniref:C6 zinc finger domain protein n=1 Tax=Moelleriella libera RCEF 2490 TaxID=1081109 RepID=A0A168DAY5_9HYPO|nr:C6 zinc finger domain protein [Moelleriella libera RCEF 2490]